jgi:hypothetical protein
MEDAQRLQDLISSNALLDAFLGEPNTAAESTAEAINNVVTPTLNSTNGTTATYECVMSSLNENGSNETQIDTPVSTGNTIFSGHEDAGSGVKEEPITVVNVSSKCDLHYSLIKE